LVLLCSFGVGKIQLYTLGVAKGKGRAVGASDKPCICRWRWQG